MNIIIGLLSIFVGFVMLFDNDIPLVRIVGIVGIISGILVIFGFK